jgi:hypothetical protein
MEINITPTTEGHEIKYLTGKVADPVTPKKIIITGQISAPRLYLSKKLEQIGFPEPPEGELIPPVELVRFQEPSKEETLLVVDKEAKTITLFIDPSHPSGTEITGKLEFTDEIKKFNIDAMVSNELYTAKELANLVKRNRRFFTDEGIASKLQASLQNLKVTGTSSIEQSHDTRGNRAAAIDIKVDSTSIPQFFSLRIPLYKGFDPITFMVEVCLIKTDGNIAFWLESCEMSELIEIEKERIFSGELEKFEKDFVILHK